MLDITSNFIRDTVINLEVTIFVLFEAHRAFASSLLNQTVLELFRKDSAAFQFVSAYFGGIGKPICGDGATLFVLHSESFERDALFTHVSRGPWRMLVAIFRFKFFGGYKSMFEDMVNYNLGTPARNTPQAFQELFGVSAPCHSATSNKGR
jgi:hypothetical protein